MEIRQGLQLEYSPGYDGQDRAGISIMEDGILVHFDVSDLLDDNGYSFQVKMSREFLMSYDSSMMSQVLKHGLKQSTVCCQSRLYLREIIQCNLKGALQKMYLESRSLSLFLCILGEIDTQEKDCENCSIISKPLEKEKIVEAKKYILEHLHQSLSISDLAQVAGTNQCYLKKGFKELYGKTIFGYIQEQRMDRARQLLSLKDKTIGEVANEVGYASQSSFTSAFKKQHGILPSELLSN